MLRPLGSSRFKHLSLSAGKSVVTSRVIKQAFFSGHFLLPPEMEGFAISGFKWYFLAVKQTG